MHRNITALVRSPRTRLTLRVLGALLLVFVGADHYYEYSVHDYSVLPTIGTLFLLNFISATAIGVILLAPLDRILHRFGRSVLQLAALSGFGIAATSLVALLVSEHTKLFGFMESNYRPAIIVAIASEAAAAVTLLLVFVTGWSAKRSSISPRVPFGDHAQPSAGTP
jgi:hypothetical protein